MISDAYVHVTCDTCGYDQEYELCACAHRSWDERYLNETMKKDGWTIEEGTHLCESCSEVDNE